MIDCVIIVADKHIGETHYLSSKEMGKSYAQRKRLYVNRAFSSDCHYCIVVGDIDARTTASEETSTGSHLSI
jgi:hypothetical protein